MVEKRLSNKMEFAAYCNIIPLGNVTTANWMNIKPTFTYWLMHQTDIILYITLMCIEYQGKNINNISSPLYLWNLPTKQKAGENAVVSTWFCEDPNGYRELYMNNHYSTTELFIILKTQYKFLASGTERGWINPIWIFLKCWRGVCPKFTTMRSMEYCSGNGKTTRLYQSLLHCH